MSADSSQIILGATRARELTDLISSARIRLASLDAAFTSEKAKVDALRARLFSAHRFLYEKLDEAKLYLKSRRRLLEALRGRVNDAKTVADADFGQAREDSRRRYEDASIELKEKRTLSSDEEKELHQLWKKLVMLYHPDRFANDPAKLKAYTHLTAAINTSKDAGDLETLREIAKDPAAFMSRKGWDTLDFSDTTDVTQLEKLLRALTVEIEKTLAELTTLRSSPEYNLLQVIGTRDEAFNEAVARQRVELERDIADLENETKAVLKSIERASYAV